MIIYVFIISSIIFIGLIIGFIIKNNNNNNNLKKSLILSSCFSDTDCDIGKKCILNPDYQKKCVLIILKNIAI